MKSTRREFLKQAVVTGIAASGLSKLIEAADNNSNIASKSKVVVATDTNVYKDEKVNKAKIDAMLDKVILKLTNKNDVKSAWKSLFNANDVVGIKVNCLFGELVSTRPEVAYSIVRGLKLAGVKENNIIIWDRATSDIIKGGYIPNRGNGIKVYGVDGNWGKQIKQGVFEGQITKIISDTCTKIINVPTLKTHHGPGISVCLKNHYGSIPNPDEYHDNMFDPALADINAIPMIKSKTKLCVVDALGGQYDGGPTLRRNAQFKHYSLIAGFDPVAIDTHCLSIIQKRREQAGLEKIPADRLAWLQSAQNRGVGICDPNKIDVIKV